MTPAAPTCPCCGHVLRCPACLGRQGGSAKTPKKAQTAAARGRLGAGRPRPSRYKPKPRS